MDRGIGSRRSTLAAVLIAALTPAGCNPGDGAQTAVSASEGSGTVASSSGSSGLATMPTTDSTQATATATTAGDPGAEGWEAAYVDGGVAITCDQSAAEMAAAGAPSLSHGETTIYVGFEQVGDNQNPIFARFDGGAKVYCERHETEAPDGRAVGLTWDGGPYAFVVYTIVGGGSSLEGKGGWIASYAPGAISGGGPKVSVVGRVEAALGTLESATFVIAVKSDNKVNSHGPRDAVRVLEGGAVEFLGASAHKPIDADVTPMDCTDYPFDSRYRFSADLGALLCADATNCVSQTPCG